MEQNLTDTNTNITKTVALGILLSLKISSILILKVFVNVSKEKSFK